ncbi:hypothetical protein [Citrobacter braakii]
MRDPLVQIASNAEGIADFSVFSTACARELSGFTAEVRIVAGAFFWRGLRAFEAHRVRNRRISELGTLGVAFAHSSCTGLLLARGHRFDCLTIGSLQLIGVGSG